MARISISIPDELAARLEPVKDHLNVSQVCRDALEHRITAFEGTAGPPWGTSPPPRIPRNVRGRFLLGLVRLGSSFSLHESLLGALILPRDRSAHCYKRLPPLEASLVVSWFPIIHAASLARRRVPRGANPATPVCCGLARREIDSLAIGPTP